MKYLVTLRCASDADVSVQTATNDREQALKIPRQKATSDRTEPLWYGSSAWHHSVGRPHGDRIAEVFVTKEASAHTQTRGLAFRSPIKHRPAERRLRIKRMMVKNYA